MNEQQYRASPELSQSELKILLNSSSLHFARRKEIEHSETPTLKFGRAVHKILLEGKAEFFKCFEKKLKANTQEGKAQAERNVTTLTDDAFDDVIKLCDEITKYGVLEQYMTGNFVVETPIFFEFDGVQCKALPDLVNHDLKVIIDIKTTDDASESFVSKSIPKFGYHQQAAFYQEAVRQKTGEVYDFIITAIEKETPFAYAQYQLDDLFLDLGLSDMSRAIMMYKNMKEVGYSSYNGGNLKVVSPPYWLIRE